MQVTSGLAEPTYQLLLESLPGNYLVLSPQLTVVAASNNFVTNTGLSPADLMGQPVEVLYALQPPEVVAEQIREWHNSLAYLQLHRSPHTMPVQGQIYFKASPGRYWQPVNSPVFSGTGELAYIIHEVKDITTEYLATQNARQSQDLFNLLSLATNDAIWDWNLLDGTIKWNEGYKTLFGFQELDPTINSWYKYIHPEDREQVIQGIHQVIDSKDQFWSDEYRFKCADGSYSDIIDRGYVLYDATGVAYRMVGSMQDNTLYKKAQQQLKESANFFKFVADTVPAFIWTSDPDGTTDYRNEYYLNFVGREQVRRPGFTWSDLLPPAEKEAIAADWLANIKAGKPFEREIPIRAASGEYRWVLSRANPKCRPDGTVIKWLGTATDIQAQKNAQKDLEDSSKRFKFLADTIPAFIWTSEPDGSTDYRNQYYYEFVGLENTRQPGFSWVNPLHPDDRKVSLEKWLHAVKTGEPYEVEHRLQSKTGEYRWILSRARPMRNEQGEILKWFGTSTDIHDHKKYQQQLQDQDARLQRMLHEAPIRLCILKGPAQLITYQNLAFSALLGNQDFVGQYAREAWPDINTQDFIRYIEEVYKTGIPFKANEQLGYYSDGSGQINAGYFNLNYQPLRNAADEVEGVLCFSVDVTEQVQARHQAESLARDLQIETERFKILTQAMPQLVWQGCPNGAVGYFNQRWQEYSGLDMPELLGWGWTQLLHPDDQERTLQRWQESTLTGAPYEIEYRLRRGSDQTYRWHLARAIPFRDEAGKIINWFGTCTDIQAQKETQEQFEDSTRQFKFLAETVPQLIWTTLADGCHDYFNSRWKEYTGYTLKESQGTEMWNNLIHPDDQAQSWEVWEHSLKTGEDYQIEQRFKRASDGAWRWFLARAKPMRNEQGEIIRWFGTSTDIHEQKLIQEQLSLISERFKFLAEAMPQKVWTAKPNGDIDYYNQQWLQYTGLSFKELQDWGWEKIMHPDELAYVTEIWQNSIYTGQDLQMENRLRCADGTYRWHLTRGLPMRNEDGTIVMWVGTNTDIHEQKVAQERLQVTNDELKRTNEDLDRFVYTASHDLKLPIINMGSLFEEIIRSCEFSDPDHAKLVELFHKSLDQIHNTIADLSEIVKVQKNINAEKDKVNLARLTEDVCQSIQDAVQQANARIITDFSAAPHLYFSKANLRSIIYNLISNAIKYRSPHRSPEIHISTTLTDKYLVLVVKDNGMGINLARHKDKLFQMFKRFHSHVPGTGLGLYMVNRIMQNNNGHIEVESNLDTGSTFRIYFRK